MKNMNEEIPQSNHLSPGNVKLILRNYCIIGDNAGTGTVAIADRMNRRLKSANISSCFDLP